MEGASRFAEYVASVEEWSPEHGFRQGPGRGVGLLLPGPANCQHHPSMDFAWRGAVWSQTALEWMGLCHNSCHRAGQCVHPENSASVSILCPWAGKEIVKMGRQGRWLVHGWFPPLFSCVVISDGETQVSSNTFEFADPSGFQHHVWLGRTSPA